MRVACLWFPRLGVQLAARQRPALAGRELVLLAGAGDRALVSGCSREAAAAGILAGMTAGQARLRSPRAAFLPDNAAHCLDELERVAAVLRLHVTPFIEVASREHLFVALPATGSRAETAALRSLAGLAGAWAGLEVRAAVAGSRREALSAARTARRGPVLVDVTAQDQERPIAAFQPETLAVAWRVTGGSSSGRALARLGTLLTARGGSFREARLALECGGITSEVRLRPETPMDDVAQLREWVEQQVERAGAVSARLELRRLGPSVAIRPCAASAARPHELRRAS